MDEITDDPDEWTDHTGITGDARVTFWQNKKNLGAFSLSRGRTYYLLSENLNKGLEELVFHESKHIEKEK